MRSVCLIESAGARSLSRGLVTDSQRECEDDISRKKSIKGSGD